ncbi:MAG TPA: hypothetical protein DD381_01925 [Lentisphaeria bacterium]|nr:MAG: hypothetical protein A2X47_12665 [Lentisphaerae bacterium GWF2_38_69]HBM15098.1 hypothetical protein [Lentisphaeria bacterium]
MAYNLIKRFMLTSAIAFCLIYPVLCPALNSITFMDKPYIYLQDAAKELGMTMSKSSEYCSLRNSTAYISFQYDKKFATINGVKISLLYPPSLKSGAPIISQKDYYNVILPILNSKTLKKQIIKTIVIDPGHGGNDNGTSGSYSKEKNIVLSISRKVANILSSSGYKVVMTRNSNKFIPLDTRAAVIDKYNGDLFVSIHCNSAKKSISGYETFVLAPQGTSSTYSTKEVNKYENGNRWDKNNERLGFEIQKALKITNSIDRGLKHARFSVLKNATKPAALVETGFLSNPGEEKLLNTPSYQDKVAKAIASGIISYAKAAANGN